MYGHGATIVFNNKGRTIFNEAGVKCPLWMSQTKLGFIKARPITDAAEVAKVRALLDVNHARDLYAGVHIIGDGQPRSTGMSGVNRTLRGVELLRRAHVLGGHCSLRDVLRTLKASGCAEGLVTHDDVAAFAKEGCGVCESMKMRRRP